MTRNSSIFTVDILKYRERVAHASATIKGLYWGAQQDCADALGRQPITISKVLRGIEINDELLVQIEGWLTTFAQPQEVLQVPQPNAA
jgi:hypothetical protein